MKHIFISDNFTGHWPVGTAMVVRAESHDAALAVAQRLCAERGLKFDGELKQWAEDSDGVILADGDY